MLYQTAGLRGFLVADVELSPSDRAMFNLLEGIALAFAFVGTERLFAGGSWWQTGGAWLLSLICSYAGVKWPYIKTKVGNRFTSGIEHIASDSRYRVAVILLVVGYISFYLLFQLYLLRTDINTYVMPRSITEEQAERLKEYLNKSEAHAVNIKYVPNDQEAADYAGQVFNAFRESKWDTDPPNHTGPAMLPPESSYVGLYIVTERIGEAINSPNPDPNHPTSELVLQDAFRYSRIENCCSGGGGMGTGGYTLLVIVGHRPMKLGPHEQTVIHKLGNWLMEVSPYR